MLATVILSEMQRSWRSTPPTVHRCQWIGDLSSSLNFILQNLLKTKTTKKPGSKTHMQKQKPQNLITHKQRHQDLVFPHRNPQLYPICKSWAKPRFKLTHNPDWIYFFITHMCQIRKIKKIVPGTMKIGKKKKKSRKKKISGDIFGGFWRFRPLRSL